MNFNFLFQQVASGEHATYLDWVVKGAEYTVSTAVLSFLVALVLGVAMGVARSLPDRSGVVANGVFELVRSIPLMVMLFITYQVVPSVFFPDAAKHMDFMVLTMSMGVLGLSVFTSMRISSHIYSNIKSISEIQKSACKVLGFTTFQTYKLVVLPQALKNSIPSLTSEFLSTVKNTSALSAIGLLELTKQVQNIIDNTSALYEPFIVILGCYLAINMVVLGSMKLLEKLSGRTA